MVIYITVWISLIVYCCVIRAMWHAENRRYAALSEEAREREWCERQW